MSLGSLGCALGAVGFIRGRCVHSGAPLGSSGSFGVFGGCALLRVVGFTRVRPGSRRGHWVRAGAPWRLSDYFGVDGFTRVRPGCRRVH